MSDWQKEQAKRCPCRGSDEYCVCQNVKQLKRATIGPVGWQPIETAPKDGSWLLIFEPSDWQPKMHVARWGTPEWHGGPKTWITMALGPNPDTYDIDDATHWMPLPEPPQ